MATNMNVSMRYSTHLPVLMAAMRRSTGDVLELGPGVFSTPVLHWLCESQKRNLLTIESDINWLRFCRQYLQSDIHKFMFVKNWDEAAPAITKPWDVVLVDHSPSSRRVTEIALLANLAKFIVVHDSEPWKDKEFNYPSIYPLFKYKFNFDKVDHQTVLLSNFIDLSDFQI